jgi:transcriptional regulator with XRE-family HTH domain
LDAALETLQSFAQSILSPKAKTMGHFRPPPKHLAKKLQQIRRSLGVSQGELVRQLGVQALIEHTTISKYELNKNEPPLAILLAYARLVGVPVEQIIDDEIELTI